METSTLNIEDEQALDRYLRGRLPDPGARLPDLGGRAWRSISILRGGVSNRTVRIGLADGRSWVLKQALERLRVPVNWRCSPERIHREAVGISIFTSLLPPGSVPALVFEDEENHLIAMEAVATPFDNWKELLLAGELREEHLKAFARLLAAIHAGGTQHLAALPVELADLSFFDALRLEPYYRHTASCRPEVSGFLSELTEEYPAHQTSLVHGDFSPKNILVHQGRLVLLDHEVIHLGDPAFDLGFSLTHLLSKAHHLAPHRTVFLAGARDYWNTYREALPAEIAAQFGADFERRVVAHTLACLIARVAGRSQLEYLSAGEKARQFSSAAALVRRPPPGVPELIAAFGRLIGATA